MAFRLAHKLLRGTAAGLRRSPALAVAAGLGLGTATAGGLIYCDMEAGFKAPKLDKNSPVHKLPVIQQIPTHAPECPPPITRKHAAHVVVDMFSTMENLPMTLTQKYPVWTFNGKTPGPMIRCRVGDTLEIRYSNNDPDLGHNIDFHAVTGPGGGAPALFAEPGQTKTGIFKMLYPGAYVYHCAAAPVPMHVANGMYGLLVVEGENGLPPVDREAYVMQGEFYYDDEDDESKPLVPSYAKGLKEDACSVVFNGREGALTEKPLTAKQGEKIRIWFGNGGPNLTSAFHVIGAIFDKVYRDADLISPPARGIQTTLVPPGGATVVELDLAHSPAGNYTLVDHAIFRLDKGAVGFLKVSGNDKKADIFASGDMPVNCPGCKLHN